MTVPAPTAGQADHYLASRADQVSWGLLPNATSRAVLRISSGQTVCIDTISHEGILEDQGRDPVAFFTRAGIPREAVLSDAVDLAASDVVHDPAVAGPHVVTGPIAVSGAGPGDVLEVEVLSLTQRAAYGVISNSHGRGALPGEMPEGTAGAAAEPVCTVARTDSNTGILPVGDGREIRFPLAPFLGLMGVGIDTHDAVNSVPPGRHGGNLDVNLLGVGARLFLAVQVPEAMFYVGDPHFSQGDGEVALTAFEAPLQAVVRLTVYSDERVRSLARSLTTPWARTAEHHVVLGLDVDLGAALRDCTRNALAWLSHEFSLPRAIGLAYLSAAADFHVSQVVDQVQGIHCSLRAADLASLTRPASARPPETG